MKLELKHIVMMLCTGSLLALTACSDDSAESKVEQRTHNLRLSLGSHQYVSDVTRASGDLPANFMDYETYRKRTDIDLPPFSQIQCYLTYYNTETTPQSWDYVPCTFTYKETVNPSDANDKDDIWTTRVPLKATPYYIYGFMPKEDVGGEVTITPYPDGSGSFDIGAVMTLKGLNAVTPSDICIIVGAQGFTKGSEEPDMSTKLGQFSFQPGDGTVDDYIFLLIDHLFAGLQFHMKLDSEYAKLRQIKIRRIDLTPVNSSDEVYETVDATVTIVANENNNNPINNISFAYHKGSSPIAATLYGAREGEEEGKFLTTAFMPFQACICPNTNKKFTLKTTYDVYDSKGNLIRENQKADNIINLEYNLNAGQIHTVNITVKPTYLYVLSDPDVDNPTFEVH